MHLVKCDKCAIVVKSDDKRIRQITLHDDEGYKIYHLCNDCWCPLEDELKKGQANNP